MKKEKEQTLIEHLEALRQVLIKSLSALGVCLVPMFWVAPFVMDAIINIMMGKNNITLNYFAPMEVFMIELKMALLLDVLVCFPYIAHEVWRFVLPALYEHEKRFIKSIVLSSSVLFVLGVLFCLFLILPMVIRFSLSFTGDYIKPMLGVSNTISLSLMLSLVFGVMFQFPLITYALIKAGIVSFESMKQKRPYVFVLILILSGILTPPDIISQLMLTLPTYALFEVGLLMAKPSKNA
ncbi:MAG: twin-arginine translocase subunit TatC [Alphaproteobacteria bacterium]|nr:twin-arginine translocase subunit TatC [Alphaproteobacteria bacterium]